MKQLGLDAFDLTFKENLQKIYFKESTSFKIASNQMVNGK